MSNATDSRETVYVVYAPYLPLSFREVIGAWELIPRAALDDDDAVDPQVARLARGYASIFQLPREPHVNVGAFGRPVDGRVGDDPQDRERLRDLRRALVVGVLDGTASPLLPEDERSPNAGHETSTSDNAEVFAHGISRDGWTSSISGGRVQILSLGIHVLPDEADVNTVRIPPPGDLLIPLMRRRLDEYYANAAWESLRRGTDEARRLGRAIDWLDATWRNTSGLTGELRIPATRAGFEVLLDSDDTFVLRDRLSALLDEPKAPKHMHTWTTRAGNPKSDQMTDLAWWFMQFSFLRNALMHGREPTAEDWVYEDVSHVHLSEWWLRQAIKETIARDGHGDVREDPTWRDTLIRHRELMQALKDAESED